MKRFILLFILILVPLTSQAEPVRYFLAGDGIVQIFNAKTKAGGEIRYRLPDGSYFKKGIEQINRVYGGEASLRLVSLLDYLQDHFQKKSKAATIRVVSGYRSPRYNEGLRRKGKLAAKTSLHLEAMAADIEIDGVGGKTLWNYARSLQCCGAGYYHGKGIHIDTGPNRSWDETSTGVGLDLGSHNKLVLLRTDQDIYLPGETVRLTLARITDYPIGVRVNSEKECRLITDRSGARSLTWKIPNDFTSKGQKKIEIEIEFCQKPFPEMPDSIESNPISILPAAFK